MRMLPAAHLSAAHLSAAQADELEVLAQQATPEVRDVLDALARCVREGAAEVALDGRPHVTLTPNQVANRLGMSRSHLYKLLDRGEIVSHRVGRDRRIAVEDLVDYEARRQEARRELAERFAHQSETREAAIDEIANLL